MSRALFWIMAIGGGILDLASKFLVFRFCGDEPVVIIPGFLAIRRVENYGGVWGGFRGHSVAFILVTVVALVAVLIFRRRYSPSSAWVEAAFGLIVAGAVGNLADRLLTFPHSRVRDFIDVQLHLPRLDHWPTFNLADAFICVGVFMLLAHSYATEKKDG